ncbi:MAG: ribonuclease HI [Acidimicrobiia bacterium]|nr:ribonuclease HI [Acidimicrobiia bacterium]MYD40243.1 ribonuclease HI [Acidimicrobiia bacterium]
MNKMRRLTVYTDGSGTASGGAGGWGWASEDHRYQWGGEPETTHEVMELTAVLQLLSYFPPEQPLLIKPDSRSVVMIFTEWLQDWRERGMRRPGGQPVANRELIETIHRLRDGRDICWVKVKSHSGDTLNDMADALAGLGRIAAKRLGQPYCVDPASLMDQDT